MNIFNNDQLTRSQFVSNLVSAVIAVLIFSITCAIKLPGDVYTSDGLDFGAFHTMMVWVFSAGIFMYICLSMKKAMDENLDWEFAADDDPNAQYRSMYSLVSWQIKLFTLVLLVGYGISCIYTKSITIYNVNVNNTLTYAQIDQEEVSYVDNLWETYSDKKGLSDESKAMFFSITGTLMDARKDNGKSAWKWTQENTPVPYSEFTSFYKDLSIFIQDKRQGYLDLEVKKQTLVRNNNIYMNELPNRWFAHFMGIKDMKYVYNKQRNQIK